MRSDGVAEVVPQFPGAVMAHVGDQHEPGSGDELGATTAAAGVDKGVVQAVDHQGGDVQGRQRVSAGAGEEHGTKLAAGARRVIGTVITARREFPYRPEIGVAPG
jgi:hypothetical protein